MATERSAEASERLAKDILEGRRGAPEAKAKAAAAKPAQAKPEDGAGAEAQRGGPRRLTYEQLAAAAGELDAECRRLRAELGRAGEYVRGLQVGNLFEYLDRLFRAMEQSVWFDDAFVQSCAREAQGLINAIGDAVRPRGAESEGAGGAASEGGDGGEA